MRAREAIAFALVAAVSASGCSKLMGDLRRDFDDGSLYASEEPTRGGRWAERGFLEESVPGGGFRGERLGTHSRSGRTPASNQFAGTTERSWVSAARSEANRRDAQREFADVSRQGNLVEGAAAATAAPTIGAKTYYKNGSRATRADFVDDSQTEGSLWASNGQTNYYFSKNPVRGIGDIISIVVEEELLKDVALEVRRTLNPAERQVELNLAQEKLRARFLSATSEKARADSIQGNAAAPERRPAAEQRLGVVPVDEPVLPVATLSDVELGPALDLKAGEPILAEILERYPNGNFKVRGTKRVRYKNGSPRLLTLVGIVRSNDISEQDILNSGNIYEYRLEATQ